MTDVNPISLECQITDPTVLSLIHDGNVLEESSIQVELDSLDSTQVIITDFDKDGARYRVNASTIEEDGTLTPWSREGSGVRSRDLTAGEAGTRVNVQITAVACDTVAPQTYNASIIIDVDKKGSRPL